MAGEIYRSPWSNLIAALQIFRSGWLCLYWKYVKSERDMLEMTYWLDEHKMLAPSHYLK